MVTASDVAVRKRHEGASYNRNLSRMVKSVSDMATVRAKFGLNFGSVMLLNGDCRDLARGSLKDRSVDAIITSPPYSIALDYVKNDAHALSAMGYHLGELRQNFIGVRGRPKDRMVLYKEDMQQVFRGMARVLRPGAVAVVVIGDATIGREVTTTSEMKLWGQPYGLFFEREMPKIVYGLYSVITDEKILFFRKE
jgi:hypothetical protein